MFPPVFDAESVLSQLTSGAITLASNSSGNFLSPPRSRDRNEAKVEVLDPWLVEAEATLLILQRQVIIRTI